MTRTEEAVSWAGRARGDPRKWSRAQSAKNAVLLAVITRCFRLGDRVPARLMLRLGRVLGTLARFLLWDARRVSVRQTHLLWNGPEAARIARACFERAGENLAASVLLRRGEVRALDWVSVSGASRAVLNDTLARQRGAVFVSAHLGPFEMVAAAIAELGFAPAILVRESYDPRLDRWVDAHRIARGVRVFHRGRPGAAVRVAKALRTGHPVGLLPDLGARVPSCAVAFLGDAALFPIGPALLAQRLGAPLVIGTLRRSRPAERSIADPATPSPPFELVITALEVSGTVAEVTQRVASALEAAILQAPEDWLWMARRRFVADAGCDPIQSAAVLAVPLNASNPGPGRAEP